MTEDDKRILPGERASDGACASCGRRHKHKDDCSTLKQREAERSPYKEG